MSTTCTCIASAQELEVQAEIARVEHQLIAQHLLFGLRHRDRIAVAEWRVAECAGDRAALHHRGRLALAHAEQAREQQQGRSADRGGLDP
jgi:hypothetical protein